MSATATETTQELVSSPLLPEGFTIPQSRFTHPSTRMRRLLETEPYLFGPGVYDPMGAQLVMYYGFKAVYFSGYSFAMSHLGTTDMDLYSNVEIADGARRTVSALRKFQLTMAVGDPEKGTPPRHLDIPPVIVDMDGGYGNIFNIQRTTELYVNAGVAAAHIEDQVLPKRCGHIGGKALIAVNEMVGKLRMARAVADDLGNPDFVVIARTDGLSAVDAPEPARGMELAINRGLHYLDSGIPDLLWCEFPTADREPVETFATEIHKRFPQARFAFNHRRNQEIFRPRIDGGLHDVNFSLQAFCRGISKSGFTHAGLAQEAWIHRQVLRINHEPGGQQLAHHFFLSHPLNRQFVGVGQMQRNAFDLNDHIASM